MMDITTVQDQSHGSEGNQPKPAFTAKDLAKWTSFVIDDEEVSTLAIEDDMDSEGSSKGSESHRKIVPPKRNSFFSKINAKFGLEHKGKIYYIFWSIFVSLIEIPLHIWIWRQQDDKHKLTMLAANFFVTVFSRTVWFKWLIYLTTLPTYYMPLCTLKMNINKAVVNNGGIHTTVAWWLLFDWMFIVAEGINDGAGGTPRETYHFFAASTTLVVLMLIMFFAMPWRHGRIYHELFELTHRYGGWSIAFIFLIDILVSLIRGGDAVYQVEDVAVYFILASIFLVMYPWLGILKAYGIDCYLYAPSSSVVLASLPKIWFGVGGTAGQLAIGWDGTGEYHSFAVLGDLGGDKTKSTMGIARAGDWTTKLIENTMKDQADGEEFDNSKNNKQICMNRVAAPGFMWLVRNYKRVVCIGTGAGIAPIASFLPKPPCEMMILWVGRNFEETYGPLYNFVAGYHNVVMVDTKKEHSEDNPYAPEATVHGNMEERRMSSFFKNNISGRMVKRRNSVRFGMKRPDIPALAKAAVEMFNADAVFIISGPKPTYEVCHECWKVGVHAYGATWDS